MISPNSAVVPDGPNNIMTFFWQWQATPIAKYSPFFFFFFSFTPSANMIHVCARERVRNLFWLLNNMAEMEESVVPIGAALVELSGSASCF